MTKIYLSASYSRREEMVNYAKQLEVYSSQFLVVSSWIWNPNSNIRRYPIQVASQNRLDIESSDLIVFFTEEIEGAKPSSGGRHWELGYYMGFYNNSINNVYVIGKLKNSFHSLIDSKNRFETFEQFLESFNKLQ